MRRQKAEIERMMAGEEATAARAKAAAEKEAIKDAERKEAEKIKDRAKKEKEAAVLQEVSVVEAPCGTLPTPPPLYSTLIFILYLLYILDIIIYIAIYFIHLCCLTSSNLFNSYGVHICSSLNTNFNSDGKESNGGRGGGEEDEGEDQGRACSR